MIRPACPASGDTGRSLPPETLESLLHPDRLVGVEGRVWFFCESPNCEVVYYTAEGDTRGRAVLRVRVGVKERESPRPLCYCFGHTAESIADEIQRTGASIVVASVAARVKAGDCFCEISNPSGRCCLGELRHEVGKAMEKIGVSESSPPPTAALAADCCAPPASDGEESSAR